MSSPVLLIVPGWVRPSAAEVEVEDAIMVVVALRKGDMPPQTGTMLRVPPLAAAA